MYTPLQATYHSHHLTLEGNDQDSFARSLVSARVEMNPHQVEAALFALKSPFSKGVMLADEVGLGKTIEAGLVISQRWAERKRRMILIVPASLRKQWQQELFEKFSIRSIILEAKTYRDATKSGRPFPFEDHNEIVIVSYEFAARKSEELQRVNWDLVVFDEAHRLRNVYKKSGSQRAKDLRNALKERFKILLTATPLQNSLMELYGLVTVIDDEHFGGESAFRSQYCGSGASSASQSILRERLMPICNRTLRRQVQEAGHINFRKRFAKTFSFEPSNLEVELYERLSEFLQRKDTVSYGDKANQLVVLQIRKIMGSSTFAVARYLETLIERLNRRERAALSMTEDVEDIFTTEEESEDDDDAGGDTVQLDPLKIAAEIEELSGLLNLANSIGKNAKGESLLGQLPAVLDEIVSKGGRRKAVIFTESVRTQKYLHQLLSENGYAEKIVLMNGSNADQESRSIFEKWRKKHDGTDKISGSKSADMKAAIVEAFKEDDKQILIATESGAEGINLQFCSLLINFDLPWNPQRVEQRIGRCHRYGQLIDVTVVNMLNLKNRTEQRIHELLSEKFHLFDGVFGASDEVLGSLMSGVDFEREVLGIVQNCRTEEEAEREFDELKARIQDTIDADMLSARAKALESLDSEVIAKLHYRKEALDKLVPEFQQRLIMVAHAELGSAQFHNGEVQRFDYEGRTYTTEWPLADENDWQFFRVSDGLGQQITEKARLRAHSEKAPALVFEPQKYPFPGQLSAVRELSGQSGWMRVIKARMPTPDAPREDLLIACIGDDGSAINSEVADRILMCPAYETALGEEFPLSEIEALQEVEFDKFSARVKRENFEWMEQEELRLDRYAADIEIEIDARISEMDAEISELQKQKRSPELSMEEKLSISRKVKALEAEQDELKLSKFERRRKVRAEVTEKLDAFSDLLNKQPVYQTLFTLRWHVA